MVTLRRGCIAWLGVALAAPSLFANDLNIYVGPDTGLWSNPANWSMGVVPNNGTAQTFTVQLNASPLLDQNALINLLTVAASQQLTLQDGRTLTLAWDPGLFNDGNILVGENSALIFGTFGTLWGEGTLHLAGSASKLSWASATLFENRSLVTGSGTVGSSGPLASFRNRGTITASNPNAGLFVLGGNGGMVNELFGVLRADGGTLILRSAFSNDAGMIEAVNGSRVEGVFPAAPGTDAVITGGTLRVAAGGRMNLRNVSNATLTSDGTGTFTLQGVPASSSQLAVLSQVALHGEVHASANFWLGGTVTNHGNMAMVNGTLGLVNPLTPATLANAGSLSTSLSVVNQAILQNSGVLSVSGTGTLTQTGGMLNSGVLEVVGPSRMLQNGSASSAGTMSISNAGIYVQNGSMTNSGMLYLSLSTYQAVGPLTNTGTISLTSSQLLLGASPAGLTGGTIVRTDSTVALIGVFAGASVPADFGNVPGVGRLDLGSAAVVSDAALSSSTGVVSVMRTANSTASTTLTRVTLASNLRVETDAAVAVSSTLTLSGTSIFVKAGAGKTGLTFNSGSVLAGSGQILFESDSRVMVPAVLTLPSGFAVRTLSANGTLSATTVMGTVSAEAPGKVLQLSAQVTNFGMMQALNGGTLVVSALGANHGVIRAGPASVAVVASSFSQSQSIGLNTGLLQADGGTLRFTGSQGFGTFSLGGTIEAINGGVLDFGVSLGQFPATMNVLSPIVLEAGSSALFTQSGQSITTIAGEGNVVLNASRNLSSFGIVARSLDVQGTLAVRPTVLALGTSKVETLSILRNSTTGAFTGGMDLSNSSFILETADAADKTLKVSLLADAIVFGKTIAAPNVRGITSSTARQDAAHYGVGLYDNAALQLTTFGEMAVDENSLLIKVARFGDANADGIVDIEDLGLLASSWQQPSRTWSAGDFNLDGFVDIEDLGILASNWQQASLFGVSADDVALASPTLAVPEPASALWLGLALPLWARRRFSDKATSFTKGRKSR